MSVEVKRTPIFSDPDLEAEHSALHTMACIIARKKSEEQTERSE